MGNNTVKATTSAVGRVRELPCGFSSKGYIACEREDDILMVSQRYMCVHQKEQLDIFS